MRCWPAARSSAGGENDYGQLGDGSIRDSHIPVSVTGISTAIALAAGERTVVRCWPAVRSGAGDTTTTASWATAPRPIPIRRSPSAGLAVPPPLRRAALHSCALLASGAVQCWGSNDYGSWAMGPIADSSIPVSVTGISTAIAITAGYSSCLRRTARWLRQMLGRNDCGQLGNGTDDRFKHSCPCPGDQCAHQAGGRA